MDRLVDLDRKKGARAKTTWDKPMMIFGDLNKKMEDSPMKKKVTGRLTRILGPLLISGAIALWGFQASAEEEWTAEQKEVLKLMKLSWEAIRNGDAEAMLPHTAEGFLDWWPGDPKPFGEKYFVQKYNLWFRGNKPFTYELKPVAVNIIDNTANVFYHYKWTGEKSPETISGRQFSVFVKQDGKWKFMGTMGCQCNRRPFCY